MLGRAKDPLASAEQFRIASKLLRPKALYFQFVCCLHDISDRTGEVLACRLLKQSNGSTVLAE
jgi:hypothetical protein